MVQQEVRFDDSLPKTRCRDIMHRVVEAVYTGQIPGDISTLENEASVEEINKAVETMKSQNKR
jgi:acetyl-CoA synthetase